MFSIKFMRRLGIFASGVAFSVIVSAATADPTPVNGSFIVDTLPSQWLIVRGTKGTASVTVRDVDGQFAYRADNFVLNASSNLLTLPALTPGFYRLTVQVPEEVAVKPVSFVVIPATRPKLDKRFGMDAGLSWYGGDDQSIGKAIDALSAAGVGSVRDRLRWSQVQLTAAVNPPLWGRFLNVARRLSLAGFSQVTSFHDSPAFTRYSSDTVTSGDRKPPRDLAALQAFGAAFARDMGPYFDGVEYWNEQNTDFYLGTPWQYASQLKAFYAGVKSARPQLKVLGGAPSRGLDEFFKATYENSGVASLDLRNQHYYANPDQTLEFVAASVAPIDAAGGATGQPGWITETGLGVQGPTGTAGPITAATERAQAAFLVKTYASGFAAGYERVFFFFFRELVEQGRANWGVLNADFSPRPSYAALAALVRHVNGKPLAGYRHVANSASSAVFFGDGTSGVVAVAWGDEAASAKWPADAKFWDMFGRPLNRSELGGSEPVLVATTSTSLVGITKLPAAAASVAARATLRIVGDIEAPGTVGKEVVGAHALEAATVAGSTVRVSGAVLANSSIVAQTLNVDCSGSSDMVPVQRQVAVGVRPNTSTPFACEFKAGSTAGVRGFMRASVSSGGVTDALVVRTVSVPDTSAAALGAKLSAPVCLTWRTRSAPIVSMTLEAKSSTGNSCMDGFISRSTLNIAGDGWVFPIADVPATVASTLNGVSFKAAPLAGVAYPLKPLMMQAVDKDGAIWLLPLATEKLASGVVQHTALFATARLADWSTVKKSALAAGSVAQMSIGFAGGGGTATDKTAFVISEMRAL